MYLQAHTFVHTLTHKHTHKYKYSKFYINKVSLKKEKSCLALWEAEAGDPEFMGYKRYYPKKQMPATI